MKLLILAHAYPDFLTSIYSAQSDLAARTYQEQFAVIDRESHIYANSVWTEALEPHGYEVTVAIANNEHAQKTWASGRGVRFNLESWQTEIAAAQVAAFQPDLLFFTSYAGLPPEWVRHLRDQNPKVRLLGIWCGMPFDSVEIFKQFDLVLTCIPESQERFSALGCHCRHLHHAFDRRVLDQIDVDRDQDIPFSFIGQLIRARDYHEERIRQLERVANAMEIAIYSPSFENFRPTPAPVLRASGPGGRLARFFADILTSRAPVKNGVVRSSLRPAVFGLAMYRILQRTRVTYNSHIDFSPVSASNRRLFESTGVGSCLLTDHKANLSSLFEADREIVTFSSADECIEKARWLLDHPRDRRAIAQAGQRRTLGDHTFAQRAGQFDAIIREALRGSPSATRTGPVPGAGHAVAERSQV